MIRRWFKFEALGDEEVGFGAAEEAMEYAAILDADCNREPCKPQPSNEAQAAGLAVLVTPHTFVVSDALAAVRDGNDC